MDRGHCRTGCGQFDRVLQRLAPALDHIGPAGFVLLKSEARPEVGGYGEGELIITGGLRTERGMNHACR